MGEEHAEFCNSNLSRGGNQRESGSGVHQRGTEITFKRTATWEEFPTGRLEFFGISNKCSLARVLCNKGSARRSALREDGQFSGGPACGNLLSCMWSRVWKRGHLTTLFFFLSVRPLSRGSLVEFLT